MILPLIKVINFSIGDVFWKLHLYWGLLVGVSEYACVCECVGDRDIQRLTWHTSIPLVSSMNLLLTETRASCGHSWNQSIAVQLTRAGNFRALPLSVWPTGEKHRMICGDMGAGQKGEGDEWAENYIAILDNESKERNHPWHEPVLKHYGGESSVNFLAHQRINLPQVAAPSNIQKHCCVLSLKLVPFLLNILDHH